jgi:hypothetical protein
MSHVTKWTSVSKIALKGLSVTGVSYETQFISKEPKLVSTLSETKRLVSVVSRNSGKASIEVLVEPKLTTLDDNNWNNCNDGKCSMDMVKQNGRFDNCNVSFFFLGLFHFFVLFCCDLSFCFVALHVPLSFGSRSKTKSFCFTKQNETA